VQRLIQNAGVDTYQFEARLRKRAQQFIAALKSAGLDAAIVEDSFRKYAVKVSVSVNGIFQGTAIIYYSPKSDSFSYSIQVLNDPSLSTVLDDAWSIREVPDEPRASIYHIYVDGSFINGATGYGAVVLKDGEVVAELCGPVDAVEVNNTRQVAGELVAVKEALKWCDQHNVRTVSIFYDYLGIEQWATGKWKTNQPLTKDYAAFVKSSPIRIHWNKVDSHTGDRWNDRADLLAKKGAGLATTEREPTRLVPAGEDLVTHLLKTAKDWVEFLMVKGIEARIDRIFNQQFIRINFIKDDKTVGIFDLYNTVKKRISPYLHNFKDEGLKLRVEAFWREFHVLRRL